MVLVLFTPFAEWTHPLDPLGLIDLSFNQEDITGFFGDCEFRVETLETDTQYGVEHVFYVERINR
jgi:hypothetical protein